MHAHFWESADIKADWLNAKDVHGNKIPFAFDGWFTLFKQSDRKDIVDKYTDMLKKGADIDFLDTAELKSLFDLFIEHADQLGDVFYKRLNSRPKTLVHGDLRLENLFNDKKDSNVFKIIDW